jgi:hypothetical protein
MPQDYTIHLKNSLMVSWSNYWNSRRFSDVLNEAQRLNGLNDLNGL